MKKSELRKIIRQVIQESFGSRRNIKEGPDQMNFWGTYHCDSPIADIFLELVTTGPNNAGDMCLSAAGVHKGGNILFPVGGLGSVGDCEGCGDHFAQYYPWQTEWEGSERSWSEALQYFQQQCCTVTGGYLPPDSPEEPNKGDLPLQTRKTPIRPGKKRPSPRRRKTPRR